MRAGFNADRYVELVATRNPARWMQHDGVTNLCPFRIKRLLHGQRTYAGASAQHRTFVVTPKSQVQRCFPAARQKCRHGTHTAMKLRTPSASIFLPEPL